MMGVAPAKRASWRIKSPIGPHPNTPTVIPADVTEIHGMQRHAERFQHGAIGVTE